MYRYFYLFFWSTQTAGLKIGLVSKSLLILILLTWLIGNLMEIGLNFGRKAPIEL